MSEKIYQVPAEWKSRAFEVTDPSGREVRYVYDRVGRQELIDGLVKLLWLLRHREVTGIAQLQVLRAGHGPMDLHFILRR